MKKKGFTLLEVMIIIFFLGLISILIVPNVIGIMSSTKKTEKQNFENSLFLAAEAYVQSTKADSLVVENDIVCVNVDELVNSGYLKSSTVDPSTKENVTESTKVIQVKMDKNEKYIYSYTDSCTENSGFKVNVEQIPGGAKLSVSDAYTISDCALTVTEGSKISDAHSCTFTGLNPQREYEYTIKITTGKENSGKFTPLPSFTPTIIKNKYKSDGSLIENGNFAYKEVVNVDFGSNNESYAYYVKSTKTGSSNLSGSAECQSDNLGHPSKCGHYASGETQLSENTWYIVRGAQKFDITYSNASSGDKLYLYTSYEKDKIYEFDLTDIDITPPNATILNNSICKTTSSGLTYIQYAFSATDDGSDIDDENVNCYAIPNISRPPTLSGTYTDMSVRKFCSVNISDYTSADSFNAYVTISDNVGNSTTATSSDIIYTHLPDC